MPSHPETRNSSDICARLEGLAVELQSRERSARSSKSSDRIYRWGGRADTDRTSFIPSVGWGTGWRVVRPGHLAVQYLSGHGAYNALNLHRSRSVLHRIPEAIHSVRATGSLRCFFRTILAIWKSRGGRLWNIEKTISFTITTLMCYDNCEKYN